MKPVISRAGSLYGTTADSQCDSAPFGAVGSSAVPVLPAAGSRRLLRLTAVVAPAVTIWRIPARTGPSSLSNDSGSGTGQDSAVAGEPVASPRCGVTVAPVATA